MSNYMDNYNAWLASDKLSDAEKSELLSIKDDETEIRERFSCLLKFGTAGLRGKMKLGMNAMNTLTVAHATAGLAALIVASGRTSEGVAIGYDSRNNSELFSKTAASVLAAAGIPVFIFDALRPTPELSFAVRELGCVAGINITASHNPKEYNGYKAYWDDGAQLPPDRADEVSGYINEIDILGDIPTIDFDEGVKSGIITIIGEEIDKKYLDCVYAQLVNSAAVPAVADTLKIVYSPLHGAGYKMVPEIMRRIGIKYLYIVDEQAVTDGNFPTVKKPNPEYPDVFELGIGIANDVGSDLIIATDPDADRVGVMARGKDGEFHTITGNQMGALLLDYIITAYENTDTMPQDPYAIKTIVTTEIITRICEAHNVTLHNVLTGFKFICEIVKNSEATGEGNFIFGFEESYGYLKGTYARDKDSVVASMLICEMTAYYKAKDMTLMDALDGLYEKYGFHYEKTTEVYMEGLDGLQRMADLMDSFRNAPPAEIAGVRVQSIGDYLTGKITNVLTKEVVPTGLPESNVLCFNLENKDTIVVRPSGTEPKIKFYYLLLAEDKADGEKKIEKYSSFFAV